MGGSNSVNFPIIHYAGRIARGIVSETSSEVCLVTVIHYICLKNYIRFVVNLSSSVVEYIVFFSQV